VTIATVVVTAMVVVMVAVRVAIATHHAAVQVVTIVTATNDLPSDLVSQPLEVVVTATQLLALRHATHTPARVTTKVSSSWCLMPPRR
jgi:hypothetical protein